MSLEDIFFKEFFSTFEELSDDMKKKYLTRVFPKFIQKLRELKKIDEYKEKELIFEKSIRIFRNPRFYEESKEISLIYIDIIKEEALVILENEGNRSGIIKVEELIKKAKNIARIAHISESYLERGESPNINFDKIYEKIVEFFFQLGDLLSANTYNNRIENIRYQIEVDRLEEIRRAEKIKKIERLESEKSQKMHIASQRAEDTYRGEILKEQLSMIKNKGRESLLDKDKEIKVRKRLKKVYFKDALSNIEQQNYNEAINLYKKSIIELNKSQKYKLAGVSLAMASFLLIKENRFEEIKKLLVQTKMALSSLGRLFSETFPVTLIEYIIELKKFQDVSMIKEVLSLFVYLPLFKEELIVLYDYLGKDYQEVTLSEESDKKVRNIKEIQKMDQILGKIQAKMGDLYLKKK